MHPDDLTCGQELAASAVIPEQFGTLFKHVAQNLREHASWVGTGDDVARTEHEAMLGVASGYEEIGRAAEQAAERMRTLHVLPQAPHDTAKLDRTAFAAWMKTKIELQTKLATLLLQHAEESQRALDQFETTG